MKKFTILPLALALILTSCGAEKLPDETTAGDTTTAAGESGETTGLSAELPDADYGGYEFRVLIRPKTTVDWAGDMFRESSGDVLDDAVYNRNQAVEEKLGVKLVKVESSDANYAGDGKNSILAGDDAYDLIMPHTRTAFGYAEEGLCLDFNDLRYVDLDKPWWNADARESFTINDKLYVMTGDISFQLLGQSMCLFFNKTLLDRYNEEYPYQTVADMKWTLEEFGRLVALCSDDLNGDGRMTDTDDLFGYSTHQWRGPMQALVICGGRVASKDKNGDIVLSLNTERVQKCFEDFFKIADSANVNLQMNKENAAKGDYFIDVFRDGRALFLSANLNNASYMRSMKDDFGIIPSPMYDESDGRYYTNVDGGLHLLIVPKTASDPDRTSAVLEALSAEGYSRVMPAYYEVALTTKYVRDELSVAMIDLIRDARVLDLGYNNNGLTGRFASFGYFLADDPNHAFASFYAKYESEVKTGLEKYLESYGK